MYPRKLLPSVLLSLVLVLAGSPAEATTAVELSLADMAAQAEYVGLGRCVDVHSAWIDRTLVTVATIAVSETLKGEEREVLTVVLPGGIDANRKFPIAVTWPGAPAIGVNEEVFLFLGSDESVPLGMTVLGFSQGKFSVLEDQSGDRFVSRDLTRVNLVTGSGIVRGQANNIPLDTFKQEVRELLAAPQQ